MEGNLSFRVAPSPEPSAEPTPTPPSAPSDDDRTAVDEQLAEPASNTTSALVVAVLAGIAIAAVMVLRARRRSREE